MPSASAEATTASAGSTSAGPTLGPVAASWAPPGTTRLTKPLDGCGLDAPDPSSVPASARAGSRMDSAMFRRTAAGIEFVTPERWPSRVGWPILRSKVASLRQPARRADDVSELRRGRPARSGTLGIFAAASIAAAALGGCQQEIPATAAPTKKTDAAAASSGPARPVRVVTAAETSVARTVTATGTLAADEQ